MGLVVQQGTRSNAGAAGAAPESAPPSCFNVVSVHHLWSLSKNI